MTPDGRIRVLHMGLDDRKGGIESFLYNMASNLDWDRFQFDFLCYGDRPAYGEELAAMGARLLPLSDRRRLQAYIRALNAALEGCDVLHLHKNSPLDFLPACVGRHRRVKVVYHAHNTQANVDRAPNAAVRTGRHVVDRNADLRLACSRAAGEWVFGEGADFEFFPNSIRLADYAYDPEARAALRAGLGLSEGDFAVGVVGRLAEQKNYPFMVRAFARLHGSVPRTRLLCAGEGPLEGEVRSLAEGLGVADSVLMLGRRDDVARLYSAMDCLCVPSLWEGFPFVTLEAQAAGLPVFASAAVPEEARVTPLVSTLELDEGLWADALASLAGSGKRRSALGGDALEAMRAFDVKNAAERLMGIYERLVDGDGEAR